MNHNRTLIFFLSLLLAVTTAHAQVIKGKVIDAETQRPVSGANVYLNGTYLCESRVKKC